MSWHVLGSFANRIRFSIPEGRPLPDEAWRRRHLGILVLLWLHVLGIAFWAALQDFSVEHILLDAGVVAAAALLAGWARLPRKLQSSLAAAVRSSRGRERRPALGPRA